MNNTKENITIFPDTNFLLHYPPLEQVDWQSLCEAKSVKIVICLQVIHELDKKKDHPLLSKRATNVIKDIKQFKKFGGSVKKNVFLEVFNYELRFNDFPQSLSPDSDDDKIVHLVKEYKKKNFEDDTVVLTEDLGMQLRCEAHGIPVLEPDDTTRLQSPKSKIEKEHQKTVQELNILKNRLPDIKVIFSKNNDNSESHQKDVLVIRGLPKVYSSLDVEEEVVKERNRLKWEIPLSHELKQVVVTSFNSKYYQEKLDDYLEEYENWLECRNKAKPIDSLSFDFFVLIYNEGTIPSEDLSVSLIFPSLFEYVACKNKVYGNFPKIPSKPTPPEKEINMLPDIFCKSKLFNKPDIMKDVVMPTIHTRFDTSIKIEKSQKDLFRINFHIPQLQHHRDKEFFHIHAAFKSIEILSSFNVGVEVIDRYMPCKESYKIPIKVLPLWEDNSV